MSVRPFRGVTMLQFSAVLAVVSLGLALELQARSLFRTMRAREVNDAVRQFARTGLIQSGPTEASLSIDGRRVALRVIARRDSANLGFPADVRTVVELLGLPCQVAREFDAQYDDGGFTSGDIRANVLLCAAGHPNDPVALVAVALRP